MACNSVREIGGLHILIHFLSKLFSVCFSLLAAVMFVCVPRTDRKKKPRRLYYIEAVRLTASETPKRSVIIIIDCQLPLTLSKLNQQN